ncbi:MAG: hypothetical protein WBA10_15710 [Elainellaceae cyanobacterium]
MEEQLRPLVQRLNTLPPQSEMQSQAVSVLAETILRSRKVGRPPKGYPLAGIYQKIYERLRQQLLEDISRAIATDDLPTVSMLAWASQLQHHAYYKGLDDALLKQLALEAQSHPPHSDLRRHALTQLVEAIRFSGRLARPHRTTFSPLFYDLLYEEAVNKTLTYVCRRIDTYDPERGQAKKFMNWVNFRLDRVIIDCRREFGESPDSLSSLRDLEAIPQPEAPKSEADSVRDCIEADRDNTFKSAHIRKQPEANFRAIALERFAGKSWDDIAEKFSVKVPTLSSFYQRCCQTFAPRIRAYLEE